MSYTLCPECAGRYYEQDPFCDTCGYQRPLEPEDIIQDFVDQESDNNLGLLHSLCITYKDIVMGKTRKERTDELKAICTSAQNAVNEHEKKAESLLSTREAAVRDLTDYEQDSKRLAGELPA